MEPRLGICWLLQRANANYPRNVSGSAPQLSPEARDWYSKIRPPWEAARPSTFKGSASFTLQKLKLGWENLLARFHTVSEYTINVHWSYIRPPHLHSIWLIPTTLNTTTCFRRSPLRRKIQNLAIMTIAPQRSLLIRALFGLSRPKAWDLTLLKRLWSWPRLWYCCPYALWYFGLGDTGHSIWIGNVSIFIRLTVGCLSPEIRSKIDWLWS